MLKKGWSIEECLKFTFRDRTESCQKWSKGYGNDEYQCVKCPSNYNTCKKSWEKTYCIECESGYRINDIGLCILICSDSNCLDCYLDSSSLSFSKRIL